MEKNKEDILMQSKNLVNTSYEVTAIQNRIFYNCLFLAQKEKTGALCCHIKLGDIQKLIPNKSQRTLAKIKESFQVLKATSLLFEKVDNGDNIECDYNLIAGSEYNKDKQEFKIYFMERRYNHILEYTVYAPLNLDILSKFTSFYSQRLYELLRLWSRTNQTITHEFTIEHLRFIFAVENKYPVYSNFKQRVLNQAVKEINKVGNMNVKFEEIKEGRKVTKIRFIILDLEPKTYFNKTNINQNKDLIIEVDDILNDAEGNQIPVKQGCFNVEAIQEQQIKNEKAPAGATAEAIDYNSFVNIPEGHILGEKPLEEFLKYCYDKNIFFYDTDTIKIFNNAQEVFIDKKQINCIDNMNHYKYFLGIFINLYEEDLSLFGAKTKRSIEVFFKSKTKE